jgi:hypothetical protein
LTSPRNQTSGFGTIINDQHMSEPTYAQLALSLDELNANLREVLALLLEDGEAAIELRTT